MSAIYKIEPKGEGEREEHYTVPNEVNPPFYLAFIEPKIQKMLS